MAPMHMLSEVSFFSGRGQLLVVGLRGREQNCSMAQRRVDKFFSKRGANFFGILGTTAYWIPLLQKF